MNNPAFTSVAQTGIFKAGKPGIVLELISFPPHPINLQILSAALPKYEYMLSLSPSFQLLNSHFVLRHFLSELPQ